MNPNERVSCPFDPVHVVERRRFQAHLIKCKRNLPSNHDFQQCTFWHLHYVRQSEFEDHLQTCEHRLQKESNKLSWDAEGSRFCEPKLIDEVTGNQPMELESWDDDTAPVFKMDQMIAKSIHMTVPMGLTKSQRKEFKESERSRLRELEEKRGASVARGNIGLAHLQEVGEQQPRKPIENPVKRLNRSRIAAKFPVPSEQDSERSSTRATLSSALSHQSRSDSGSIVSIGRGRGILAGWNQVADFDRAKSPRFSLDDFPTL